MTDTSLLRALPSVDEVLRRPETQELLEASPRWAVIEAIRLAVDGRRAAILAASAGSAEVSAEVSAQAVRSELEGLLRPALRQVINATGVVVHTNLGRAPLAAAAFERLRTVASGYSNLEYDLAAGGRGSRHEHLRGLAADVAGAEDAVVVNNNAAAVLLMLSTLAADREVVISRAELVEIGGGFRIPDVIIQGGARLREVGTTNRTRLADYEAALSEETGAFLKVHQSNFAVVGFTEEVSTKELAGLARSSGVPLVVDLGSGAMIEGYGPGLGAEPTVRSTLSGGADLVSFSGDKLLGGPQAGIVLGRADLVSQVRRHPLMRALRPGKLDLAALEATFELWRDGREAEIPVRRMLGLDPSAARARAGRFARKLRKEAPTLEVEVWAVEGRAGGGTLPLGAAPGWAAALQAPGVTAARLEGALRDGDPPVIGRILDERVLVDLRTVEPSQERELLRRLSEAAAAVTAETTTS